MPENEEADMDTIHSLELIYSNPKVRGGSPCIAGTGLRVLDVVMSMQFADRSPEQMAASYQVPIAHIHAALAYYYENKDEIDEEIREDIRIGRELVKEGWGRPENSAYLREVLNEISVQHRAAIQKAMSEAPNDMDYLREVFGEIAAHQRAAIQKAMSKAPNNLASLREIINNVTAQQKAEIQKAMSKASDSANPELHRVLREINDSLTTRIPGQN